VRRDHNWFAKTQTALHDSPLNDRQFFHRALDPEIAPRQHYRVGGLDHFVDLTNCGLIFYFRDNLCPAPELF
jgi:hypothetical protein